MDLIKKSQHEAQQRQRHVAQIIDEMIANGEVINFGTVALRGDVSRNYLYRHSEFRSIIEACRVSGLSKKELQREVIQLRIKVRKLEQRLEIEP